jgi:hypothetical protein
VTFDPLRDRTCERVTDQGSRDGAWGIMERCAAPAHREHEGTVVAEHRVFGLRFAELHPLYVTKAERKGHTREEVDTVISWLTGYDAEGLRQAIDDGVDLRTFFEQAPAMNPNAALITGVICGHRVESIEDPLMQRIRYMDKLVDEVARGKRMASILRG